MSNLKKSLKEKLGEDWHDFFGNEGVWRNDNNPEEEGLKPTVSIFITHSTDKDVIVGDHFSISVRHVRGFHGKGFMATLRYRLDGDFGENCRAFYGTNQNAYDKACFSGVKSLRRREKEMNKTMAEIALLKKLEVEGASKEKKIKAWKKIYDK